MFSIQGKLNDDYDLNKASILIEQGKTDELDKFLEGKSKELKYGAILKALQTGDGITAKKLIESVGGFEQITKDESFSSLLSKPLTSDELKKYVEQSSLTKTQKERREELLEKVQSGEASNAEANEFLKELGDNSFLTKSGKTITGKDLYDQYNSRKEIETDNEEAMTILEKIKKGTATESDIKAFEDDNESR